MDNFSANIEDASPSYGTSDFKGMESVDVQSNGSVSFDSMMDTAEDFVSKGSSSGSSWKLLLEPLYPLFFYILFTFFTCKTGVISRQICPATITFFFIFSLF